MIACKYRGIGDSGGMLGILLESICRFARRRWRCPETEYRRSKMRQDDWVGAFGGMRGLAELVPPEN
jgi:hypothetical protein